MAITPPVPPRPSQPLKSQEGTLPLRQKVAYGTGYWSVILANKGVDEFANPVYNIILGLNPALVGVVLTVQRGWDAITDPLIGHWSDKTKSRWGPRRPFMAVGAILTAITFAALWLASPAWTPSAQFTYFLVVGLAFTLASTLMIVPYHALGFEMTDHPEERTQLMGWKALFLHLGVISAGWLFAVASLSIWSSSTQGVLMASLAAGVVIAITMLIPALTLPRPVARARPRTRPQAPKIGLIPGLKQLSRNRPFAILTAITGIIFFSFQSVGALNIYVNVYHVHAGDTARAAVMHGLWTTVYHVVATALIPLVIRAASRFGKKQTLIGCLAIALVANALKWVCYTPDNPWLMLIVPAILAPGYSAFWLLQASMMGDVCDYDHWESGQSRSGLVSALISWVQKTTGSIAVLLSGFLLVWIGFNRDLGGDQSDSTLLHMRLLFMIIPAVGILVSIACVFRYPLNEARMAEIRRDLHDQE